MFRRIVLTVVAVSLSTTAFAQSSATATANATAKILTPIAITKLTDLNFGTLVSGPAPGTVIVDPAGTRSASGGVSLVSSSPTAAQFNVTGQGSTAYTIAVPGSISITNGTDTMVVNTFTSNPSGTGTLSALGAQQLNVGATLNVAASQASGNYTGTFNVTVAY